MAKHKSNRRKRKRQKQTQPSTQGKTAQALKKRLSLCMIVKNEEKALPNCLQSVQGLIDELIVVDTGSTDRTVEVAKRFGAKVYPFEWIDDFSAARNESIKHATGDWILWLDADDILPETYHSTIRSLLASPKDRAFFFRLENVGGDEAVCYQLRMFPNLPGVTYTMPVHEQVLPSLLQLGVTQMVNVDVSVTHTGYTDAETIAAKNARYLEIMERWLETHPHDYVTRSHIARIYHTTERNEAAIREYQTIIDDEKCRQENELIYLSSLIYIGRSYLGLGQYNEALSAFGEALKVEPNYDIAYICFGEAYTLLGETDQAIAYLEKVRDKGGMAVSFLPVEVRSLNYHCRHLLGKNYERKERFDEALAEYRAAIEIDPRRTEAPTSLAQLLANRGEMDEAHRVLAGAIEADPNEPENYINQATLYIDQARYDEAEQALQTALKHNPAHSHAHFQQGQLYRLRGDLEAAALAYQKATEHNPSSVEAHTNLGHLYIEQEVFDKAEDAFEAAIRTCNATGKAVPLDLHLGYAYSCARNHHHGRVIETYREISRQVEEAPSIVNWVELGQILLADRLPKMAEYAMQTAKALDASADRAMEGFGDVLMAGGRYAEAREQYENALQLAPERVEIFFKLGDCYLQLKAADVAQMCYQKGLDANPLLNRT